MCLGVVLAVQVQEPWERGCEAQGLRRGVGLGSESIWDGMGTMLEGPLTDSHTY